MKSILYFALAALLPSLPAKAQLTAPIATATATTYPVTGKVTDRSTGQSLPGVTVLVQDTTIGVSTNHDGTYTLQVPSNKKTLIFSAVGFVQQEIKLTGQKTINVALTQDSKSLNEVVVTGYGLLGRAAGVTVRVPRNGSLARKNKRITAKYGYPYPSQPAEPGAGESYATVRENGFRSTTKDPLSTFSIDVDAASYSNVRRFLQQGQLPPADAVRTEELINYFQYDYPQPAPTSTEPFRIITELAQCPWNTEHHLVQIALQGRTVPTEKLPPANLVFLVDVSGSMAGEDRLGLIQQALRLLTKELRPQDKVAMAVYAGAAGTVLPPTPGSRRADILKAIDHLQAGGSTAGGAGLRLAYQLARENFNKEGNNRVILCTDGDFNVGEQSDNSMERLITQERETGVFLTVLGVGQGNYQDKKMELLADKGNGNYAYLDNLDEARRVLVQQFGGTLFTIAKDVKLQVEFNPARVREYRLIGYENRLLAAEDFNNDRKDAGELGSGHTVTALYEVVPVGARTSVDPLKYQPTPAVPKASASAELLTVKLRYKQPQGTSSKLLEQSLTGQARPLAEASENLRFAAAVAQFGMLLHQSDYRGTATWETTTSLAKGAKQFDPDGYRAELVRLLKLAEGMQPSPIEVGAR